MFFSALNALSAVNQIFSGVTHDSIHFLQKRSVLIWFTGALLAQQLPEGKWHHNREQTIDIVHYKAELNLDMAASRLSGEATVRFHPRGALDAFSLDAFNLNVTQVQLLQGDSRSALDFFPTAALWPFCWIARIPRRKPSA